MYYKQYTNFAFFQTTLAPIGHGFGRDLEQIASLAPTWSLAIVALHLNHRLSSEVIHDLNAVNRDSLRFKFSATPGFIGSLVIILCCGCPFFLQSSYLSQSCLHGGAANRSLCLWERSSRLTPRYIRTSGGSGPTSRDWESMRETLER